MPTITLTFDVTAAQEAKARNWWTRVNNTSTVKFASMEEFLEDVVVGMVRTGIRDQDEPPARDDWDLLTDEQRARVKDIFAEIA